MSSPLLQLLALVLLLATSLARAGDLVSPASSARTEAELGSYLADQTAIGEAALQGASEWLRLRTDRFEVEIDEPLAIERLPVAGAHYRARSIGKDVQPARRMSVWVDGYVDGVLVVSHLLGITVKAFVSAWIPNADLATGARLYPGFFSRATVDAAEKGAWPWGGALDGRRLRGTLLEGRYLQASHLDSPPDVARGDRIELSSQVGDVVIKAEAEALQDGRVGDRIAVRVPDAKGPVYADVLAPRRAEILR